MKEYMEIALEEAYKGINAGDGGPFGAVIVMDDKVVGRGHNCVVKGKDPTLHGEIMAIRDACKNLDTFSLKGASIYTTAEPCPMCMGAILWAGINHIFYGCDVMDTENIGFNDSNFYKMIADKNYDIKEVDRDKCLQLFEDYKKIKNKTIY